MHAHPDDETTTMGGTLARSAGEGVRTVLVTCTGGELGADFEPDHDPAEAQAKLAMRRRAELDCAAQALGIQRVIWLGYRDSGMAGTPGNDDPRSFHRADHVEATRRLAVVIRQEKPQVIVTYNEIGGYGHPDHIKAHRITLAAFDLAADPTRWPEIGPAWQVNKLYFTVWHRRVMARLAGLLVEMRLRRWWVAVWRRSSLPVTWRTDAPVELVGALVSRLVSAVWERLPAESVSFVVDRLWDRLQVGAPNPFRGRAIDLLGTPERLVTTTVDVSRWLDQKRAAWRCHRSQISETFFLLHVPKERLRGDLGCEHYIRVRAPADSPSSEDDLFSGLRA